MLIRVCLFVFFVQGSLFLRAHSKSSEVLLAMDKQATGGRGWRVGKKKEKRKAPGIAYLQCPLPMSIILLNNEPM